MRKTKKTFESSKIYGCGKIAPFVTIIGLTVYIRIFSFQIKLVLVVIAIIFSTAIPNRYQST